MAKQYREAIGPWVPFLPVVSDRPAPVSDARSCTQAAHHEVATNHRRQHQRPLRRPAAGNPPRRAHGARHDPKAAPGAEERISYQIPSFKLGGQYLVYVAAYERHIGVYPAPTGDAAFNAAAKPYRSGKATLRFPLDEPVPLNLITGVVKFRKLEMLEHVRKKKAAR